MEITFEPAECMGGGDDILPLVSMEPSAKKMPGSVMGSIFQVCEMVCY